VKNNRPIRFYHPHFFKAIVLSFALLSPLPAVGQELNVQVYAWPLESEGAPQHLNYQVCNYDNGQHNTPIDVFSLEGLNVWLDYQRIQWPDGWQPAIVNNSVIWIANDGEEIWPNQCRDRFIVFSPNTEWVYGIDYIVGGENGAAFGKTYGHAW
jgi:hypothetical protein